MQAEGGADPGDLVGNFRVRLRLGFNQSAACSRWSWRSCDHHVMTPMFVRLMHGQLEPFAQQTTDACPYACYIKGVIHDMHGYSSSFII